MRQRFYWEPSVAGASWPGDIQGINLKPFNWVKIDNRGAGDLLVGFSIPSASHADYIAKVKAGKFRVFNVAGPENKVDEDGGDAFPRELHLVAVAATSAMIEVSDTPLVDMLFTI